LKTLFTADKKKPLIEGLNAGYKYVISDERKRLPFI
jgi:hypothetical protein